MLPSMFGLVAAAALWAAWNGVIFTIDPGTEHRAETAWLIFAAVLILSGLRQRASPSPPLDTSRATKPLFALIPVVASVALYAPILSIGLLSDDFILLPRALNGRWFDAAWVYVRPLPLAMWWAIDRVAPASQAIAAIHLFAVVVHGVNAWLVFVLAQRLSLSRAASVIAAALFLTWPFNVEAIAWPSAVFDACMTLFVLLAVIILRDEKKPSRINIAAMAMVTAAAVACKETGIILPLLLVLIAAFDERPHRWRVVPCIVASLAVVAIYLAMRFTLAPPNNLYPQELIKNKLLTRPFAALGFGVHRDVLKSAPWIAFGLAIGWVALLTRAAHKWNRRVFRTLLLAVCWVLVSVAPLWTMFYVTDTLENSRYLYLASTMWAIAVTALVANGQTMSRAARVLAVVAIAGSAVITLAHQRTWREAARERDRIIAAWAHVPAECDPWRATGLPDSVAGAYVFRNGFPDAVAIKSSIYSESCTAEWKDHAFVVNPH